MKWKRSPNAFAAAALAIALISLCSCASRSHNPVTKINAGKVFAVTADKTNFYRYGPLQGNGADQQLPKDTLVTLIRPSFGYCKVQLVSGAAEGYVASEDIKPASPALLASLNPTPTPSSASESENFDVQSSEPPPPETLPDPDLPPATAEPTP
jgi:hypothetical protein